MRIKNKKGFTLIELLVVVLIIGILAAIALPQYKKVTEKAKMVEAVTIVKSIAEAQQRYYMINNRYLTCQETEGLDIEVPGSDNCPDYTPCKCKNTGNFIYSFSNASGGSIALAHRRPLYKYNIYVLPSSNKIGCNSGNSNYKPSKIQKELCDELNEKGYL